MSRKSVLLTALIVVFTVTLCLPFEVEKARASGTIYIRATGEVEGTDEIQRDRDVYTFKGNVYNCIVIEKNDIVIDGAGYTLQGTGSGKGIKLDDRSNVTIKNMEINTFHEGIYLWGSNNTISANSITNNKEGILLSRSSNNVISGNNVTANDYYGIYAYQGSSNNIIFENNMTNSHSGILLRTSSSNNRISRNNFESNYYGIFLESSSNNSVYHNNFIDNHEQVNIFESTNVWYDGYLSGGNYWSDYTGVDEKRGPHQNETGSDGIGDAQYVINANNTDYYPLIRPYGSIRNLNTSLSYLTIQSAIDAPETLNGHTIFVEEGTYYEHIVVTKSISLIGEDKNNTIIDGNRTGTVVHIITNNVNFTGFTIRNSGRIAFDSGIYLDHSSESNISRNNMINNQAGIWVKFSSNNVLCGNNITNNDVGGIVLGMASSSNVVCENSVTNSGCGIWLGRASSTILRRNVMTNNMYGFGVSGRALSEFVHDIDTSNTIDDEPIYYFVDESNLIINPKTFPNIGYLALVNSENITIEDLTSTNNAQGILLAYTTGCTIRSANAVNNLCGVGLYFSSDNRLYRNTFRNSGDCGVWLFSSSQNVFYNNNFVNNTKNVESEGSSNIWDNGYPSGGNYWSGYSGVDSCHGPYRNETGSDGLADKPYVINMNNQDNYPLMGMFSDFNATSEYHVQTICNSSISGLQFNGTAISFNVSGENGTTGFCRIRIPIALMNSTYRVFVNGTEVLPAPLPLPCSNSTHTYLYFNYTHSTQEVTITPEFPSFLILPLFMTATLLAVIVYRRKHTM